MAKILWVEDQSHWIDKFQPILEGTDFDGQATQLQVFRFAEAACQHITQSPADLAPDIAILDAHMNGRSSAGFTVSRALERKWPQLPVVYLSEYSGTEIEQGAFEQGGVQDFIAKHQRNVEAVLCWRIKAALRHTQLRQQEAPAQGQMLNSGALTIDTLTWEVYWRGQKLMNPSNPKRPLAPTPRKILRFLVEASPRPLSTFQIAERLDADPEKFSYANYRQHIKTLRHSLQAAGAFQAAAVGKQSEDQEDFLELCKAGKGIATFGDQGAYSWKPID